MSSPVDCRLYSRRSGTSFSFTVTHNHGNNQIRVIHNSPVGNGQCIPQFAPFVDRTGKLRADVTWEAGRGGKPGDEFDGTLLVPRQCWIEWVKRVFEP